MKLLPFVITLFISLSLIGCSNQSSSNSTEHASTALHLQRSHSLPPTFILRGVMTVGHEVRSFTPCGSQQQFWLDLPPTALNKAMSLNSTPYQPLYGEVVGHLEKPSHTGLDADFTARFIVDQVNIISAENPYRCQHPSQSTRAFGNEPSWSLSFNEKSIQFQRIGEKSQSIDLLDRNIRPNKRHYKLDGGSLTLTQGMCSDGMSDSVYGWHSEFSLNNQHYKGCATLGNIDPTAQWSGTYQATHTESNGFSVSLMLNSDHTAITQYEYGADEAPLVEKGFWQQVSNDKVKVTMTRHQQQYLVSERVFSRSGQTISTREEHINGAKYPIANGGLILFRTLENKE